MKKIFLVFVSVFLLLLLPSCGKAKESPVEDFEYEMVEGEITITKYIGSDLEVYIPEKINDRPVTVIGEEAFAEYDMTYVSMPDTIVYIGEYAFNDCVCLSKISFSKNLTEIGTGAFKDCEALTEIDLPDKLESIRGYSFSGCEALKQIKLPKSLKTIGENAFSSCKSLEKIEFPDSLQGIGAGAFQGCGFESVDLPEGLERVGKNSFASCEKLKELRIPDNTEIEIYLSKDNLGYVGVTTTFYSPVGTRSVTYYNEYYDFAQGDTTFEKIDTVLVVSKDSYAHSQVSKWDCSKYGLTVEIE